MSRAKWPRSGSMRSSTATDWCSSSGANASPACCRPTHGDPHPAYRRRGKRDRSDKAYIINKQPWALILGASSGFGAAAALELARAGMNIFGVHMDRRDQVEHVVALETKIREAGRQCHFVNDNATLDDTRKECVAELTHRMAEPAGTLRVLLHSLAYPAFKPLVGAEEVINRHQLELVLRRDGQFAHLLESGWLWAGASIAARAFSP